MKIYIVRHGETDWNREKKLLGWTDHALNAQGIKQALELAKELPLDFDVLYSSPLLRAHQTAKILSDNLNLPIILRDELKERTFGELEGKTWQEMPADFRDIDRKQQYDYTTYQGESAEQVKARVLRFIEYLKQQKHQKPLLVSHGGIVRMLHFLFSQGEMPVIKNASMNIFEV